MPQNTWDSLVPGNPKANLLLRARDAAKRAARQGDWSKYTYLIRRTAELSEDSSSKKRLGQTTKRK